MTDPIYVETLIHASLEDLWARTQRPDQHQRWDLRFSGITYLPRPDQAAAQQFRYVTRIGFGLQVAGAGESVGERELADGSRSSALKFWSVSPLSLIRDGSGYWQYIPTPDGVRFLTWYDYRTRWGIAGRVIDRVAFRPMIGWATAWSFDRLRRWLEDGIDPASSARQALAHAVARLALVFIFAYHGLVPKLLLHHPDESAPLLHAGIDPSTATALVTAAGVAELLIAAALAATWRKPHLPRLCIVGMLIAVATVAVTAPQFIGSAFNVVTLNLAVIALAIIDLVTLRDLTTATRCLRVPPPMVA